MLSPSPRFLTIFELRQILPCCATFPPFRPKRLEKVRKSNNIYIFAGYNAHYARGRTLRLRAIVRRARGRAVVNAPSRAQNKPRKMLEKLAKQTAIYGISTIVVRLLSYLLTPLYTRVFGQAAYGVVTDV